LAVLPFLIKIKLNLGAFRLAQQLCSQHHLVCESRPINLSILWPYSSALVCVRAPRHKDSVWPSDTFPAPTARF
jgi:hypothetical protein